jgi:orotidine-5'-phosphate decarboxylase
MSPSRQAAKPPELIVALDVPTFKEAKEFVDLLYPKVKIFKVGSVLFTAYGPKVIEMIRKKGAQVFLDLKFNDIPNTMVGAIREALKFKVAMLTVHTLSGPIALKEISRITKGSSTKILGVTILTSICPNFLRDLKIKRSLPEEVLYLARMAKRCGLDGIVCSVQEARLIRNNLGNNFTIVNPGIRLKATKANDQKRPATPKEAIESGANYIVVGRPILEAKDPLKMVREILQEMSGD